MTLSEFIATAKTVKRKNDLSTSPRVVRLIWRRACSISSAMQGEPFLAGAVIREVRRLLPTVSPPRYFSATFNLAR